MLPDRVSNPGPLTYESGALPIALRGPAIKVELSTVKNVFYAPNFEEVEGAYWFGPVRLTVCPSDRLSVRPSVRYALCWL